MAKITNLANASAIVNDIRNHLIAWVHAFQTMEEVRDMEAGDYAFTFSTVYPSAKGHEQEISKIVKPTLKKFKDLCDWLCSVKIPAIVISGDDDTLAIIFERINSKGTQLSKYQIYRAIWTKRYDVSSSKIQDLIKYTKELYEKMESDGMGVVDSDFDDFDSVSFMSAKKLNLFEIAYGLGKMPGRKYPHLFDVSAKPADVDSLGFSLITACVGMKNSQSKDLHTQFDAVVGNGRVNLFLERLIQCVDTANKFVGKFNKFKVNAGGEVDPLHTEFQIVSLIANIFVVRYAAYEKDDSDRIVSYTLSLQRSNSAWDEYEQSLKESTWKRYCLDILNSRWKGSGDKKMDSIVFDNVYYAQPLSWNDFEAGIMQWYNASKLDKSEYRRVVPPQEAEKLFLAMLYLPIFKAADQVDPSKYDVEHLATKKLMRICLERYHDNLRLPIGSIGNLCLLPQQENRSKQDKTIYDDKKFLQNSKYTLEELESKFTFTSQTDLEWIMDNTLGMEQFEEKYMAYIDARFARLLEKIKSNYE